jgi:hypothetical protein
VWKMAPSTVVTITAQIKANTIRKIHISAPSEFLLPGNSLYDRTEYH